MKQVTLYSRPGCGLCEEMKEQLEALRSRAAFTLAEVNIDHDPELRRLYGEKIPVLAIDGEEAFHYRLDPGRFLKLIEGSH